MKNIPKIGKNLKVNILNIKQYVIIGEFPVCTGINRANDPANAVHYRVPCMHRDKSAERQYYTAFFAIQKNHNSTFYCFLFF